MIESDEIPAEAFEILGNETRLRVLYVLAERRREAPYDRGLSFSDLCERVGMRDSGKFNYHLNRLRGRFVERTETGYRLNYAGMSMIGAILAGTYNADASREPWDLGKPCPVCEGPLYASFEDGFIAVECDNGHTAFRTGFPPNAATRPHEDVVKLATILMRQYIELAIRETCPFCYGSMYGTIHESGRDRPEEETISSHTFEPLCIQCGMHFEIPVEFCVLCQPVATAFCHDNGVDIFGDKPYWAIQIEEEKENVIQISENPRQFDVTITLRDETLRAMVDDTAKIIKAKRE